VGELVGFGVVGVIVGAKVVGFAVVGIAVGRTVVGLLLGVAVG
jgi:hypothetical protein